VLILIIFLVYIQKRLHLFFLPVSVTYICITNLKYFKMTYVKKPVNSAAPSNNKVWTAQEDAILTEMAQSKSTTAKIAMVLGRTKASIWGRKSMLGIKSRLSSSKGQNISVPTTLTTKNRRPKAAMDNPQTNVVKVGAKAAKMKMPKMGKTAKMSAEFEMLSKLAKQTGAKIVITFE
jgi:hypothetical protein